MQISVGLIWIVIEGVFKDAGQAIEVVVVVGIAVPVPLRACQAEKLSLTTV